MAWAAGRQHYQGGDATMRPAISIKVTHPSEVVTRCGNATKKRLNAHCHGKTSNDPVHCRLLTRNRVYNYVSWMKWFVLTAEKSGEGANNGHSTIFHTAHSLRSTWYGFLLSGGKHYRHQLHRDKPLLFQPIHRTFFINVGNYQNLRETHTNINTPPQRHHKCDICKCSFHDSSQLLKLTLRAKRGRNHSHAYSVESIRISRIL